MHAGSPSHCHDLLVNVISNTCALVSENVHLNYLIISNFNVNGDQQTNRVNMVNKTLQAKSIE